MRYQELTELFQQTVPWKWETTWLGESATFVVNDKKVVVVINEDFRGWEVFFKVNDEIELTGGGDAYLILSTVVAIIKEFINKHHPAAIYFTADKKERSRIKLYNTLVSKLASQLPYKLTTSWGTRGHPDEDNYDENDPICMEVVHYWTFTK